MPAYAADFLTNYEIGLEDDLRCRCAGTARSSPEVEEVPVRFLGANSFTEIHNGRDARINGIETDLNYVARRPDAERGGRLHRRENQGEHLQRRRSIDPTPDCTASIRRRARFHRRAERHATADHAQVQGDRDRALQLAGVGRVKAHVQGGDRLPGIGAVVAASSSTRPAARLQSSTNPNVFRASFTSSTLVDLFAGLDWPKWNVELFGTNIFDERNELSPASPAAAARGVMIVPGRPRTIGMRAGMKF